MFQQTKVEVASIGEHVRLAMGSSSWTMHYETALLLSAEMRAAAKLAKRFAGDFSRLWGVSGVLHDAEKGPNAGQPFTPGKVYPVARDLTRKEEVRCEQIGTLVRVFLRNDRADLPYLAAFQISQWIRLRAKESKVRAGDLRRWDSIATPSTMTLQ